MQIAGYIKTSLIEWPGKVSSVVFVPGCNFRCPFCHNRDLVEVQRYKGTKVQRYKENDVLQDLKERKKWVEAVVVTGGEPTLQKDLPKFLKLLKSLKLLKMIHTNGTRPDVINELLINRLTDYIAMDIKGDLEEYEKYTLKKGNYEIKDLKKTMELIIKNGVEYEFRTTVVPGLHNIKNLICLAEQIKFVVQSSKFKVQSCRWFLQQFRPMNTLDKRYLKIEPYSKRKLQRICRELQKIIPQTYLRGI